NADLAVGPIPTPIRQDINDLDFTKPYMSSGINLLIKNPPETVRSIGLMLEPFATEVWVMISLAFIVVSLSLFLIGRFSPYERTNTSKEKDIKKARTIFGLKNSFLFAASTLSWQGYKDAPKSLSGRILMCIWFMFTVFVIVAYTSCLCAILTSRSESIPQQLPFSDYDDIINTKEVKLGAMKYHHVYQLLKDGKVSHNNIFSKLFNYIDESQEWIHKNEEGVQRVKDSSGKYALLMETVKAEYIAATHCDLITYGEKLSSLGYTFAAQKNSPLMERMNLAISELIEEGYIKELINKYIYTKHVCPVYDKTRLVPRTGGTATYNRVVSSLDMRDMTIPFLFLFLGILGASATLGAEHYYKNKLASKNAESKSRRPLNTFVCKAPNSSPPPPPVYKLSSKLQQSELAAEEQTLQSEKECLDEIDVNNFEVIVLNEMTEKGNDTNVQIEEIPTLLEEKGDKIHETVWKHLATPIFTDRHILVSVATPWVFSQDLGFSDSDLGNGVFGCKSWVPTWVFHIFRVATLILVTVWQVVIMAKSIRSKHRRKMRNIKRQFFAKKDLEKLKKVVSSSSLSESLVTVRTVQELTVIKAIEKNEGSTMDTDKPASEFNRKTKQDVNGHYPEWMNQRAVKKHKAKLSKSKKNVGKKIKW
ncbi:Glutamate receptor 1, partial [Bulinus truncatus]